MVIFNRCAPSPLTAAYPPIAAFPALRPARVLLVRIPLGPSPSLHRLRGGSLRLVRQLRSYYCWVRLPAFVHHRLSVSLPDADQKRDCPGRTRDLPSSDAILLRVICSSTPAGRAWPRLAALSMLRSTLCTVSAPATYPLRGSITHPTQPLCIRSCKQFAAARVDFDHIELRSPRIT